MKRNQIMAKSYTFANYSADLYQSKQTFGVKNAVACQSEERQL